MDQVRSPLPGLSGPTAGARTGRDGFVRLRFERRGARTVLTERRFRTPLQVLEPLTFPDDPAVGAVLLNPTGGVLGGDHLDTELVIAEGAHVIVSTPSATRVYGSRSAPARQSTRVHVEKDGVLEYVPDHLIPHPEARLVQTLDIDLDPGAGLLLWDAWALGRPARDELWTFASLRSRVHVRCGGAPVYVDRFSIEGGDPRPGLGGAEGHAYFASWMAFAAPRDWPAFASALADLVENRPEIRGSASVLGRGGCVVRLLARSAYALQEARDALWQTSRRTLYGLDAVALRRG